MKKSYVILLIISIFLNVGLVYIFLFKGETVVTDDHRVELKMSESNRAFVMEEMRDFLESVQMINEGILSQNPEKVIKAGQRSGGSVIGHAPEGLLRSLPIGFKQLGFSTHDIFDEIASSATENFEPKETQKQLNELLNNCVACHQSYKIGLGIK